MRTSRRVLKNIFSLTIAEIANKGIVFISTAYLARAIMPEGFGMLGYANALLVYFLLIANLGFNIVGSREIAKQHDLVPRYVNSIVTIRSLLSVIALAGMFFMPYILNKDAPEKYVIWICSLNLLSNAILLDWVFQGIERMEVLAIRQVVTSLLNLAGIIIFVTSKSDVVIAMVISVAAAALNAGWMLLLYIKFYGGVKFNFDFKLWFNLLKSSIPISFSNFFIVILNTLNILMLGQLKTDHETGIYVAGFKLLVLTIVPSGIIQNAFFPLLSRADTIEEKQKLMQKYSLLMFLCGTFISCLFFTYSEFIITVTYGSNYLDTIVVLRVIMITSAIVYINTNFFPPLVSWQKERTVMYAIISGGIVNIILNLLIIPKYGAVGAAVATIFSEGTIMIGLSFQFYKVVRRLYIVNFLKSLAYSVSSCGIGYLCFRNGVHPVISATVSVIIFCFAIFAFKTITVNELKGYFAK